MKKYFYVLLFALTFPTIVWGAEYSIKETKRCPDNAGMTCDLSGHPITGKVVGRYSNGNLRSETDYKDGRIDGVVKEYYENGNLRSEISMKGYEFDGISRTYYEDGTLKSEVFIQNGKVISRYLHDNEKMRMNNEKTETHGRKHKPLPTIPPDEEANKNGKEIGDGVEMLVIDETTKEEVSVGDDYFALIQKSPECVDKGIEGEYIYNHTHPCQKWKKKYQNGKLVEFISYEIVPFSKNSGYDGLNEERISSRVTWYDNGQISSIWDSTGYQFFDKSSGDLIKDCEGNRVTGECEEYDKDKKEWVRYFYEAF